METLTIVLLTLAAEFLVAIVAGCYLMVKKEYFNYRRLVPNAEALLEIGHAFWVEEYPDEKRSRVQVGDIFFEDPYVYRAALRDIARLERTGASINVEYYSYRNTVLPKDEVEKSLRGYHKKLISWQNENQGRPHEANRPRPPYRSALTTLVIRHP